MGHICWGEQEKGKCRIHWKIGHQARQWLSCTAAYCKAALKSVALSHRLWSVLVQEREQFRCDIFSKGTLEGFIFSAHLQATVSSLWKENKAFPPQLEGKAWVQFTGRERAFCLSSFLEPVVLLTWRSPIEREWGERYRASEAHTAAAAASVITANANINCAEKGKCFKEVKKSSLVI